MNNMISNRCNFFKFLLLFAMSSSMVWNSGVSGAAEMTSNVSQDIDFPDKLDGSKDIGWEYRKFVKAGNFREIQCMSCEKIMYGGISRVKQHITGVGGEVSKCILASNKEKHLHNENLEAAKMKVDKKKREYEARQEAQIYEERYTEYSELSLIGSKKSHALGPQDRMMDDGK